MGALHRNESQAKCLKLQAAKFLDDVEALQPARRHPGTAAGLELVLPRHVSVPSSRADQSFGKVSNALD